LFSNDWEEKLNFKDPKAVELAILDEMRRLNSHKDSEVDIQPSPS